MKHTQKKNSSGLAIETAPTVALSRNGHLEESKPGQPGAITLGSKQEYNNKGNFDPDMKVHYEPEGISNKIQYSVCVAGEMAAHADTLTITGDRANDGPCTITLKFPQPDNKTIPVGDRGTMVEHPQSLYGGNPNGVEVVFNAEKNELTYKSQPDPVILGLASFPKLLAAIKQSVET